MTTTPTTNVAQEAYKAWKEGECWDHPKVSIGFLAGYEAGAQAERERADEWREVAKAFYDARSPDGHDDAMLQYENLMDKEKKESK